jgi:tRNA modification GTPase
MCPSCTLYKKEIPNMLTEDTICAISTAPGKGGIAIARVSGKEAITITNRLFRAARPGKTLTQAHSQTLTYGDIVDTDGKVIDTVLVSVFRAPHSFTGEDATEISCHGSLYIQQQILRRLIDCGCRMAQPGEYTKRAFMNGKMDLSQAEAVADLIASNSAASHRVAMNQMRGGFSRELADLRASLLKFVSLIELELDFSTEDVEFADRQQLTDLVHTIQHKISRLSDSFSLGNAIKNGIPVAIVGETNVGKSTLLNWLLNEDKAIVSDVKGTTRDVIEDTFIYGGVQFRLIDTAGLRTTNDKVEKMGIERSYKKMEEASIVLLMIDATTPAKDAAQFINAHLPRLNGKEVIVLINKQDAIDKTQQEALEAIALPGTHCQRLFVSARENQNKKALLDTLLSLSHINETDDDSTIVTNMRHYEALQRALEAINRVSGGLDLGLSGDLLSRDIHDCIDALGEITGEISNDEVLGNIFEHFCVGK